MASGHGDSHSSGLGMYVAIFAVLFVVTAFEALPLFGLLDIPPALLLGLSAGKFCLVAFFFMHLWGDPPIFTRLFFIPLGMVILTIAVLMSLFGTWTLTYQQPHSDGPRDTDEIAARYPSRWDGDCAVWLTSPLTGNVYCSQGIGGNTVALAAYPKASDKKIDPVMLDWDKKSADEKKAALMQVGQGVYSGNCQACHGPNGEGGVIAPPLKGDPLATAADPTEHLTVILKGLNGKVINGVSYAAAMPGWAQLSDEEIAAVTTFERNSWGNAASVVEPAQVTALR